MTIPGFISSVYVVLQYFVFPENGCFVVLGLVISVGYPRDRLRIATMK